MNKRYFFLSLLGVFIAGIMVAIAVFGFNSYSNSKYDEGFLDGLIQGRREVVDAILINVANEGNVVIRQGDQSITLILERLVEPVIESSESE